MMLFNATYSRPVIKSITIVPFGGIGNRLRVLNSLLNICSNRTYQVKVSWHLNKELNLPLEDIYTSIGYDYSMVNKILFFLFSNFIKVSKVSKFNDLYVNILSLVYDTVITDKTIETSSFEELKRKIERGTRIFIATCYKFGEFENFDNLVLKECIRIYVENILELNEKSIGVHIRRGDHSEIIKESSLECYCKKMDEILNHSTCNFFLATDDIQVKNELVMKYGEKIITQNIELSRNTRSGIINAIIDIYLLAKTSKIICNPKSSFAIMASQIGHKKELIHV